MGTDRPEDAWGEGHEVAAGGRVGGVFIFVDPLGRPCIFLTPWGAPMDMFYPPGALMHVYFCLTPGALMDFMSF